jgi:hypothetical protein
MMRKNFLPGGLARPATLRSFLLCLAGLCLYLSDPAAAHPKSTAAGIDSSQSVFIDYLYPEAFLGPTWIQIDLPSSSVLLDDLRIVTANRRWTLQICGSVSKPDSCVNALAGWDPRGAGWRGDFRSPTWSLSYQDLDGLRKLHLRVTPMAGDWMILRIQVRATP